MVMRVGRNISQSLAKASAIGASKEVYFGFQPAPLMAWLSKMGRLANLIMSQGKAHGRKDRKHGVDSFYAQACRRCGTHKGSNR